MLKERLCDITGWKMNQCNSHVWRKNPLCNDQDDHVNKNEKWFDMIFSLNYEFPRCSLENLKRMNENVSPWEIMLEVKRAEVIGMFEIRYGVK